MNSNPDEYKMRWFVHPERPVTPVLIFVHALFVAISVYIFLAMIIGNPEFFTEPSERFNLGILSTMSGAVLLSFIFNWGWWAPYMVIGATIGSLFPHRSSCYGFGYHSVINSAILTGLVCGCLLGGIFEFLRRKKSVVPGDSKVV